MMFQTAKLDYHLIITNAGLGGKKTVHQKKKDGSRSLAKMTLHKIKLCESTHPK